MDNNFIKICNSLKKEIDSSNKIVLTTHFNPDGDGLGSAIAFFHYLSDIKKESKVIVDSHITHPYDSLDMTSDVEVYSTELHDLWLSDVDLIIVFDIGDLKRIGSLYSLLQKDGIRSVSIDHHPPRNSEVININMVYDSAPATGYIVWKFLNTISLYNKIYPLKIGRPLYMSLITDTGSFKYSNTTSDAHMMAANLIESGVKGYEIQRDIYEQQKFISILLLSKVVQDLNCSKNMKVVWTIITQNMLEEIGASEHDIDGITEYIRSIKNVEISFMVLELSDGSYRINFRSSGNYSVNDIAEIFKGGGHKFAAGARIDKTFSINEIEQKILAVINSKIPGEVDVN